MQKAVVRYRTKIAPNEIAGLFGPGAVCFEYMEQFIDPENLDPELLEKIKNAVCEKVYKIMISGHFGDLRGARKLLEKLNVERISIPGEDIIVLNDALMRVSEYNLLMLRYAKPMGMETYDLKKARKILKDAGYSDEELMNDEKVKKIVNWRHVLMELKIKKIKMIGSVQELLEE